MASVSININIGKALKELEQDVSDLYKKADKKFATAESRMVLYAKARAPVDTGFHERNIFKSAEKGGRRFLSAGMFAAAKYASFLEFGTRRMSKRPHIVPAAERALKQLIEDLKGLKV